MLKPDAIDGPKRADVRRLTAARTAARRAIAAANAQRYASIRAAFWAELGAVVRSASPFLISLLTLEGLTIDDIVGRLQPPQGWPRRARASLLAKVHPRGPHFLRHVAAGWAPYDWPHPANRSNCQVVLTSGDTATVRVVGHSIEVSVKLDGVEYSTMFGHLSIRIRSCLPETLVMASVGRLAEDVVDHPAVVGQGWRVVVSDVGPNALQGTAFVVATGAAAYRMPFINVSAI